ncbi:MAG: hypothetical protein AAF823_13955 [Planctomycetota bacterium]
MTAAPASTVRETQRAKRLAAYSIAAATGAVVAPQASANIVEVVGAGIDILNGGSLSWDVDQDGNYDILLKNYSNAFGSYYNYMGAFVRYAPGALVTFNAGLEYVTALSAGDTIDSTTIGSFIGGMAFQNNPNSQFDNVQDAFMGFAFPINGVNHYGWAKVDINAAAGTFFLEEWAFQAQPGVGIEAGETDGIGEDFNNDGALDALDIDLMFDEINGLAVDLTFDLNNDGVIDNNDADTLIELFIGTNYGDANLDIQVGTPDLAILAANFGQSVTSWAQGDFNGDDTVNTSDLAILAANFGANVPPPPLSTAAIPEPGTLAAAAAIGLAALRRRSASRRASLAELADGARGLRTYRQR